MMGHNLFFCPILILVLFTEISSHLWSLVYEYSFIRETKSIRKLRASGSAETPTTHAAYFFKAAVFCLSGEKPAHQASVTPFSSAVTFCNRDHTQLILSFRVVDQIKHLDFLLENACKIADPLSHVGRLHQHYLKPLSSARSQTLIPT